MRTARPVLAVCALLLALTACGSSDEPIAAPPSAGGSDAPAADAPAGDVAPGDTLIATVGTPDNPEDFVIDFTTEDGAAITELPAGSYTIEVSDPARIHNWALLRGDEELVDSGIPETGTTTYEVELTAGEYEYNCTPHVNSMNGTFTVV